MISTSIPDPLEFKVWTDSVRVYEEEPRQSRVVAAFWYLQEALDFVDYCRFRAGIPCVLTSPGGSRVYPVCAAEQPKSGPGWHGLGAAEQQPSSPAGPVFVR